MREGTARLLSASKHPAQVQEAAKNLLTSNTRIIAYMTELQRRKTAEVLGNSVPAEGNQLPCRSQVSVSDIRIPLMWRDADHFKNKGDYRRYAVFCMLKVGTEIYDTSMIRDVDRTMTDITFDDVVLFDEIPHDFDMKLEVYCHKLHEEFSVSNTPKKLRKKINDISGSVGRSVGKRLSGLNDSDVIGNMVLGPKFELVAKGSLHLSDVDNSVRTFDLELETNSGWKVFRGSMEICGSIRFGLVFASAQIAPRVVLNLCKNCNQTLLKTAVRKTEARGFNIATGSFSLLFCVSISASIGKISSMHRAYA
ncbi:rhotekin [Elysia marginata]|uniref:Rhotekin n=1 Tax=Elysia marginata TaxID=1093978 RepID=A0AAV4HJ62_9GAST|nr:rhotekin [Elysia marginata]